MPRRILITLMNLNLYNAIETFGSVYYRNFWSLYLYLIFIGLLFKNKRNLAKKRGSSWVFRKRRKIPPFRGGR